VKNNYIFDMFITQTHCMTLEGLKYGAQVVWWTFVVHFFDILEPVTPCYHSYSLYGKKKWLGYSSKILLLWSTGEKSSGFETT